MTVSSAAVRSCRALGIEMPSMTRVFPSLESISSQQWGGALRNYQKLVGEFLFAPAIEKCLGGSFSNSSSYDNQNRMDLGQKPPE